MEQTQKLHRSLVKLLEEIVRNPYNEDNLQSKATAWINANFDIHNTDACMDKWGYMSNMRDGYEEAFKENARRSLLNDETLMMKVAEQLISPNAGQSAPMPWETDVPPVTPEEHRITYRFSLLVPK